ncbi:MAG: hypothetical protein AAF335_04725 [Bacteroidota bacterium]
MKKSFLLFVLLIAFPQKIKTAQGAEEKKEEERQYVFEARSIEQGLILPLSNIETNKNQLTK